MMMVHGDEFSSLWDFGDWYEYFSDEWWRDLCLIGEREERGEVFGSGEVEGVEGGCLGEQVAHRFIENSNLV